MTIRLINGIIKSIIIIKRETSICLEMINDSSLEIVQGLWSSTTWPPCAERC